MGNTVQLHENLGGFAFSAAPMPSWGPFAANDADVADFDADGDWDIFAATAGGGGEYLVNLSGVADTHAPHLPLVEALADGTAAAEQLPVRAHVYDNAPHYATARNPTWIEISVDGVALPAIPALSSSGQVFRAQLPGNLVGQVSYRFVSQDGFGNTGASALRTYASAVPGPFQVAYGVAVPGLGGGAPELRALSVPFAESTLYLALSSDAPGTLAVVGIGTQPLQPGVQVPGLLFLQVIGQILVLETLALDGAGDAMVSAPLGPLQPGLTAYAQGFVLDATAAGEAFASSKGLAITTQ